MLFQAPLYSVTYKDKALQSPSGPGEQLLI